MWAVCVRGRHFNGRQLSGLNKSIFRLWDKSSSGVGGAYARDKNTSAGLCAKNAGGGGGLCARGAYLRDTTVIESRTFYCKSRENIPLMSSVAFNCQGSLRKV